MRADGAQPNPSALSILSGLPVVLSFFFFNDTATTEIYTLSLHDALPILIDATALQMTSRWREAGGRRQEDNGRRPERSEEHTSELQSPCNLVCRLLLEKKKKDHTLASIQSMEMPMSTFTSCYADARPLWS